MDTATKDLDAPGQAEFHATSLQIGDVIDGRYTIERLLGSGGMGTVYLARDEHLGRSVAVKLVHEDLLGRVELQRGFAAEARAMALVRHPNVVTIHTLGEHSGQPYIVMEHVPGCDLATWRRTHGRPSWQQALVILGPLCCGVQAIHDAGALHRDIKAGNVLLESNGRIALSDFGLSVPVDDITAQLGFSFGTPANIAPEVARQDELDPLLATRIDVYALGILAYELLTGGPPFPMHSLAGLLSAHASTPPPLPSAQRDGLPQAFDAVLLRALAKDPAERTPSAAVFRSDLFAAAKKAEAVTNTPRFIVVDDDIATLGVLQDLLHMAFPDAEVAAFADPRTAFTFATHAQPDVVITDLHMPQGGGARLCAALRGDPRTATTPLVVLTGQGGAADWLHLRHVGVDRFLVKPIELDALEETIRSLLRRRQGRNASVRSSFAGR